MRSYSVEIYLELENPQTGEPVEFTITAEVVHDPGDWWQPPDTTIDWALEPTPSWELTNHQEERIEEAILFEC